MKDCLKFGLGKTERIWLFQTLQDFVAEIQNERPVDGFIDEGVIKRLEIQKETEGLNIWEVRDPGRAGRIIFIREDPCAIIVAAVDKGRGSHSQAVRRGVKRWKDYLKERAK